MSQLCKEPDPQHENEIEAFLIRLPPPKVWPVQKWHIIINYKSQKVGQEKHIWLN